MNFLTLSNDQNPAKPSTDLLNKVWFLFEFVHILMWHRQHYKTQGKSRNNQSHFFDIFLRTLLLLANNMRHFLPLLISICMSSGSVFAKGRRHGASRSSSPQNIFLYRMHLDLKAGDEVEADEYGAHRAFLMDVNPEAVKNATSIKFPHGETYDL